MVGSNAPSSPIVKAGDGGDSKGPIGAEASLLESLCGCGSLDEESAAAALPLVPREDIDAPEFMWEGRDADVIWEGICRMAAVLITVSAMVLVLMSFVALLVRGALHLQMGWPAYREGMKRWIVWLDAVANAITKGFSLEENIQVRMKAVYNYALTMLQETIYGSVNWLVSSVSTSVSTLGVVGLYVLFGLSRPLPMGGRAGALVRSYIWKKTLVSLLYGTCVSLLFLVLGNDLAFFFGMVSFFLNYVPEVGAIFSMLVPVPVILLDGRLTSPILVLCVAIIGQLLLKLAFSNILEMKLVEQDREMSIHPVWVLLGLNYFGYIWGPVGMLISVPVLALMKSAALSSLVSDDGLSRNWAPNFLACLEGRPGAWGAGRRSRFISEVYAASAPAAHGRAAPAGKGADCCSGGDSASSNGEAEDSGSTGDHMPQPPPLLSVAHQHNSEGPALGRRLGSPSPSPARGVPPRAGSSGDRPCSPPLGAAARAPRARAALHTPELVERGRRHQRPSNDSTPTVRFEHSPAAAAADEVSRAPAGG